MQKAVDDAFARLPKAYRTDQVRQQIAQVVLYGEKNYDRSARQFIAELIFTIDRAMDRLAGLKSR